MELPNFPSLDDIWKVVMIVAPTLLTILKMSESRSKRGQFLLNLADTAWQSVEAWRNKNTKDGKKPDKTLSENRFIEEVGKVTKLSKTEILKMKQWAEIRSSAEKLKNGIGH